MGVGADFTKQGYKHYASPETLAQSSVNPTVADTIIGGPAGDFPGDASRNSYGGFAELFVPVLKNFDVTLSGRYDKYERIENDQTYDQNSVFVGSQKQGNSQSSGTYKFAVAYRPVEQLLLRGSYGTGFRAPTLNNVVAPLQNGGSTGFHACPITSGPLLPLCRPGSSEYNFLVGGNALSGDTGLKAEKSKQFTLGFRVEPIKELSLGFDFWDVKLRNQIATLPENTVFDDPVTYASLFTSYFDPIQRQNVLAAILTPFNLAKSEFQGIDWDHTLTLPTSIGKFSFNWTGTYTIKASQAIPGSDTVQSVGRFNEFNDVTFRLISKLVANWSPSKSQTHTLTANYHSGYHDEQITPADVAVRILNADGTYGSYVTSNRNVASYTTFDWQSKYNFTKDLSLTAGIRNIFDRDPPFSQRIAGGGNALGFDGRYTDPLGRNYYLVGNYKF